MRQVFFIPKWKPVSVNKLIGKRHFSAALKREDAAMIAAYFHAEKCSRATCKRRVDLKVSIAGRGRSPDADNMLKSLLDGLVLCGGLMEDGPKFCEIGQITVERVSEHCVGTQITLTDLPDQNEGSQAIVDGCSTERSAS